MDPLTPYLQIMNQWGTAAAKGARVQPPNHKGKVDITLRYKTPAGRIEYAAEVRTHFRHEDPYGIIRRLHGLTAGDQRALLLAPMTTERQREALRKGGVDYVDLAGNAHLERRGFLVHVEGKRARSVAKPPADKIFRRGGLQVVYVLLVTPDAVRWPYRPLAQAAGVALRTANYVMEGLRAEGFVGGQRNLRQLVRREDLVARWVDAYRTELRPKLLMGIYRTRPRPRARLLKEIGAYFRDQRLPWALTGAEAAFRLTHHYRDEHVVIFAPRELTDFEETVGCMPDPNGDLHLLRHFCEKVQEPKKGPGLPLAHPLLVYAELLADGTERAIETGQVLRDQLLEDLTNEH
jgi:hypothetical protein